MCVQCGCSKTAIGGKGLESKTGKPDLPGGAYSGVGGSPVKNQGKK